MSRTQLRIAAGWTLAFALCLRAPVAAQDVRVALTTDSARVGDLVGVAAVFADDAEDFRADVARFIDGADEINRHILFDVAAADGEDEHCILCVDA